MVVKPFFRISLGLLGTAPFQSLGRRLQRRIFRTSGSGFKLRTFGIQSFIGR